MMTKIEFIQLLQQAYSEGITTRDGFLTYSGIPKSKWISFFGTWNQFKIEAGLTETKHQKKLLTNVAMHSDGDRIEKLNKEKREYSEKYLKPSNDRFQTILVASDIHDENCDKFYRRTFIDTVKRTQPNSIVLLGDIFDLAEFSKYVVDIRTYNVVDKIKWVHSFLEDIREASPDTQIDFVEGNHESVEENTEILTDRGFFPAKHITMNHRIASYDLYTGNISYDKPVAIKFTENQPLISVKGFNTEELLYEKHKIDVDNELVYVDTFLDGYINENRFRKSGNIITKGVDYTDDELRIIAWIVCNGRLKNYMYFKIQARRKVKPFKELFTRLGIPFRCSDKDKMFYRVTCDRTTLKYKQIMQGKTSFPESFRRLNKRQLLVVLDEMTRMETYRRRNMDHWFTVDSKSVDILQVACISNGITFKYRLNPSLRYHCKIGFTMNADANVAYVNRCGYGNIVSIQSVNETLITRRNGNIAFTGNCRLLKHLTESTPQMLTLLSDLHGFTVSSLLGLDKYEVNYISRSDLRVFRESEIKKELSKNYLLKNECLLFHHFPQGKNLGFPGVNGHHHKYVVDSLYNPIFGSYQWVQLGCGHIRQAGYTDAAASWNNGFMICHVDTLKKRTQFEYIDVTHDSCVIGGKFYKRTEEEIINW